MKEFNMTRVKANAKKLGVEVKKSINPKKKIDVFKNGKKIASIGATGYKDYTITLDEKKRENYSKRFAKTKKIIGSPSYYAWHLLWN